MQELQICFVSVNARDNEYLFRKEAVGGEGGIVGEGECDSPDCCAHKTCLKVHLVS